MTDDSMMEAGVETLRKISSDSSIWASRLSNVLITKPDVDAEIGLLKDESLILIVLSA